MTTDLLPTTGMALLGAPDSDVGPKDAAAHSTPVQAMQVELTQDIVDELLESVRSGRSPQILFGRTPQLKCGDKTHVLQTSPEAHRHELYKTHGTGDDAHLEFAAVINHSLVVQKADHVTAGVDSALEQLRSSMAAISEFKEANKTIVGEATPGRTPGHRRFPSTGFKPTHLAPAKLGSPLLSAPSSPMHKRAPTSQPGNTRELVLAALRMPVIHLLAREPSTEAALAAACRTSLASMRDLLPKVAKKTSSPDGDKWQLTDKSFREVKPWKFPYQSAEDRQQAIDGAIKSFDRQRLAKDDKLWQILLPREERGQGICLSRSTVKAPEAKAKPGTPMHMPKISDLTKKKPVSKKATTDKTTEKRPRAIKETEPKPKSAMKEKYLAREKPTVKVRENREAKDEPTKPATLSNSQTAAPSHLNPPSGAASKIRTKKVPAAEGNNHNTPRVKPKMSARDLHREPPKRQFKSTMPVNTKPKNPSPLSVSPPVNASDFEDSHPVHKALAAAPSPAKNASGNSDRSLKRKANDLDSDIHNHNLAVKKPHVDRSTANHTPSHVNGRLNGSTPSTTSSRKRRTDESSSSNTPTTTAPKVRKVTNIDTGLASRYHHNNPRASPGASSSSTTSPSMPSLSFRQTVELSRRFQTYYKKYEELYWKLADATTPPTDTQRNALLDMHKKLEEMKREIKAGAMTHR